jgi:hypothetical protein
MIEYLIGGYMKEIIFYPRSQYIKSIIDPPIPIDVPDWYKKIPIYQKTNFAPDNKLFVNNGEVNYSVKSCMPFLDSFTSGYSFNLWCDIQIKKDEFSGESIASWGTTDTELTPVQARPDPGTPVFDGFDKMLFTWVSHWGIKTPKGYSCLFTHPLNRTDLPFITSSGIMDTDEWGIWGNQPFSLKKDFEGVIPAGTPIIQVIPFKRDDWKSNIDDSLTEWANIENIKSRSKFRGYYKNKYWKRKKYQ